MRSGNRIRNLWMPAVITMLVAGSGCASRGYVRTQVGESAETLSASISDNREAIERTGQDLATLETETVQANQQQDEQLAQTQSMVESAQAEIAEVRTIAQGAERLAGGADERAVTLARMFEDRSRFEIADSREVYFGFASAAIDSAHGEDFESVSQMLESDPDAILVLEGRTDSTGDPAYNERLGQERIEAARNYLVLELGVPVYRIYGFSFGEARPDYDNEVLEERQKNRSVRMLVLSPASGTSVAALPE